MRSKSWELLGKLRSIHKWTPPKHTLAADHDAGMNIVVTQDTEPRAQQRLSHPRQSVVTNIRDMPEVVAEDMQFQAHRNSRYSRRTST